MSETVLYELQNDQAILTLNRPEKRNSMALDADRFHGADEIEDDDDIQIIVLRGAGGVFCTGMDLEGGQDEELSADESPYMNLLKRFTSIDKVVIAEVDGTVMAGGMGLVAASDLVFSPTVPLSIYRALWGLFRHGHAILNSASWLSECVSIDPYHGNHQRHRSQGNSSGG